MSIRCTRLGNIILSGVALFLLSAGMSCADTITPIVPESRTELYSALYNPAGPSDALKIARLDLTFKCYQIGSVYKYEYTLSNPWSNAEYNNVPNKRDIAPISDFTLLISDVQDSYIPIGTPSTWGLEQASTADGMYRFHWYANQSGLTPGNSLVFSFTANTRPSNDPILETAMSFGGETYGPAAVPEPGTILAAFSILAPVGLVFRRRQMK